MIQTIVQLPELIQIILVPDPGQIQDVIDGTGPWGGALLLTQIQVIMIVEKIQVIIMVFKKVYRITRPIEGERKEYGWYEK